MHARAITCSLVCPLLLLAGCGGDQGRSGVDVSVMTFNVLCSFCNPDYHPWEERLDAFADILDRHDPDLVGLQELTWTEEVDDFLALRPGFESVYFLGEEAGPFGLTDYPDATILYRSDRFTLLEHGFFWLSETPEVPWSSGWAEGMQFARIATWARLEDDLTGRALLFVTTHFDNNPPNQDYSAPLLLERTAPYAAEGPVIVTGDFNSQPVDPAYRTLVEGTDGTGFHLDNAFDYAAEWTVDSGQEPQPAYDPDDRIDHVFTAGQGVEWTCPLWTVDVRTYGQPPLAPSDHKAICVRLRHESAR